MKNVHVTYRDDITGEETGEIHDLDKEIFDQK